MSTRPGPLNGLRVVEIAGLGPGPFAGMMLADAGAEVIRVDRTGEPEPYQFTDVLARNRRSVAIDVRTAAGLDLVLKLIDSADAVYEGYRPGVAERLGFGPDVCLRRNPRLVYGRMSGWGQNGPLGRAAGHDINYIAVAGALHGVGEANRPPTPPINYVGDFGGGGMLLAFGLVSAILDSSRTGCGQVVDAAMVDGAALQTAFLHGLAASNLWDDQAREANLLDGAAPFYRVYRCADGRFVAFGAVEPKFYRNLLTGLGLDPQQWPQNDQSRWPEQRERISEIVAGRTREQWVDIFAKLDACVSPVLTMREAPEHAHARARVAFTLVDGVVHPRAAPRFAAHPHLVPSPPVRPGTHTRSVLTELGLSASEVDALDRDGVIQ